MCCLVLLKVALGIVVGVAQLDGVSVCRSGGEGDDDHLLDGGVDHGAVDLLTVAVVDGDVHVAEVLVELDVDGIVACAGFDGVGTDAEHHIPPKYDFIIPIRNKVQFTSRVSCCCNGLGVPSGKNHNAENGEEKCFFVHCSYNFCLTLVCVNSQRKNVTFDKAVKPSYELFSQKRLYKML